MGRLLCLIHCNRSCIRCDLIQYTRSLCETDPCPGHRTHPTKIPTKETVLHRRSCIDCEFFTCVASILWKRRALPHRNRSCARCRFRRGPLQTISTVSFPEYLEKYESHWLATYQGWSSAKCSLYTQYLGTFVILHSRSVRYQNFSGFAEKETIYRVVAVHHHHPWCIGTYWDLLLCRSFDLK